MAIRRLLPPAKRETGGALSHRDGLTFGECAGSDGATHASSGVNGGPFALPPFPPFICVVRASRRARVSARPSSTWESCSSNIARYRSSSLVASSHRPSMFRSRRDMVMMLPLLCEGLCAHGARRTIELLSEMLAVMRTKKFRIETTPDPRLMRIPNDARREKQDPPF